METRTQGPKMTDRIWQIAAGPYFQDPRAPDLRTSSPSPCTCPLLLHVASAQPPLHPNLF